MSDMLRILALPEVPLISDDEVEELSRQVVQAHAFEGRCKCKETCFGKPLRLLHDQASGLRAFRAKGGLFAGIRVGGGKSALSWLIAADVFARNPGARVLLLLPPGLVKQYVTRSIKWANSHLVGWHPRVVSFYKKPKNMRLTLAKAALPGLYVMPYSLLSEEDASELLARINAELAILDEAHEISSADPQSGKARAFWRWVDVHDPQGVVMSGSFERQNLRAYHKVMRWVLRENSPLPRTVFECERWSLATHSKADGRLSPDQVNLMAPLVRWALKRDEGRFKGDASLTPRTARIAYQVRLTSAPGVVVSTSGPGISASLSVEAVTPLQHGPELAKLIARLYSHAEGPNGELFAHAVHTHELHRQLSAGFWLEQQWPNVPGVEEAKEVFALRNVYRFELKNFLRSITSKRLKLDTPTAVGNYMKHHERAPKGWDTLYETWLEWKEADRPGLPKTTPVLRLVDDFKIKAAVKWAKKHRERAIVWVKHTAFGDLVHQALLKAGLRSVRKGAGAHWLRRDGSETAVCVANMESHYQGRDLQEFQHQLLLQWCRPAHRAEQLLGRTFRKGQEAEHLTVHVALATEFEHQAVQAMLYDTIFAKQIHGGSRLWLLADWVDPLPKEYPADFLRERGFRLADDARGEALDDEGEDE